jgi:hypothetical protein
MTSVVPADELGSRRRLLAELDRLTEQLRDLTSTEVAAGGRFPDHVRRHGRWLL